MDQHAIILFDGQCNLCNGAVDFVISRDKKKHFRYGSLQSEKGRSLVKQYGMDTGKMDTMILISGNKAYSRSTAALRIAKELGGAWPAMSVFMIVPAPIRDLVYNWIGANRYRWFGKQDTCRLPTPAEQGLFL